MFNSTSSVRGFLNSNLHDEPEDKIRGLDKKTKEPIRRKIIIYIFVVKSKILAFRSL